MKASDLRAGGRFIWLKQHSPGGYTLPIATVLDEPYINLRGEVTFPVKYDEPTPSAGDVYDVYFLKPDDYVVEQVR